jgi:hypothetical protein
MKVLVKGPGQPGELQTFPDDVNERLDALMMAVGGPVEAVELSGQLTAVVNRNAAQGRKPRNAYGFCGTIVLCGTADGALTDLPQDDPLLLEAI